MSDNQDDIARRVRGLLNKTVANGCTEAEALAAAQAARRIMDQHRLTQSDVEIEAEPIDDVLVDRPTDHKLAAVDRCLLAIERYCGVEAWFTYRTRHGSVDRVPDMERKRRIRMLGLKNDVEMARYLYAMIGTAIASEAKTFIKLNPSPWREPAATRRLSQSFQVGMAARISERLFDMARAAEATARTGSGTALVVVKNAVVTEAFAKLGIKMSGKLSGPRARDNQGWDAGRAAGDRVNLSRPVGGAAQGRIAS